MNVEQINNIKIDPRILEVDPQYVRIMRSIDRCRSSYLLEYSGKYSKSIDNTFDKIKRRFQNLLMEITIFRLSCLSEKDIKDVAVFRNNQFGEAFTFSQNLINLMTSKLDKRNNLKDFDDN
jgi:hypothetical protein